MEEKGGEREGAKLWKREREGEREMGVSGSVFFYRIRALLLLNMSGMFCWGFLLSIFGVEARKV